MKEKKVYDFPFEKVKDQVVSALKKRGAKGTVADLVTSTGLPSFQVEKVLPVISSQCRGHLQVTESGEILYYFPQGMANRETGTAAQLKQFFKKVLSITGKVLRFLFKTWMMVMLVVYFIIFALLMLLAIVGATAASAAKKDDSSSSNKNSFFGFHLVIKLIELAVNLWVYSGSANRKLGKKRPFYKGVFAFVFGTGVKDEDWVILEKKAFINFVQKNKGCITEPELMALTGRSFQETSSFLSRLLVEYEGEPKVTDEGTLFYFFPELLKTSSSAQDLYLEPRPLIPFSGNEPSVTRWIFGLNLFNVIFSSYFLYFGLASQPENDLSFLYYFTAGLLGVSGFSSPEFLTTLVLGIIPGIYSGLFFGIPLLRRFQENAKNQTIKINNFRKKVVKKILENPEQVQLEKILPESEIEAPFLGQKLEKWKESVVRDLAQDRALDVGVSGPQTFEYYISDISRETLDMKKEREKIDPRQFALGAKVFDSGE